MGRTRRKKKRTQNPLQSEGEPEKVPRSFVFSRGKIPPLLRKLEMDLRKVMQPYTALHLKENKKNSMKDFLHVAGPLGVTHFLILSHTETASYLRVARCPRGPTLTFKILSYSLDADIARVQLRPRAPAALFKDPPLIVLAGFGVEGEHLKLTTTMFQNIFPAINVNTVKLSTCQRVVLLSYNKDTKLIEFRHYSITLQPVGVSRPLRKLVQHRKIPDLRGLGDVSEFVTKAGYGSESEAEDEAATVQLTRDIGHLNRSSQKSAVKLQEIGPRLTLQLVKVEEGLCSGAIIYHEFVTKTAEEIAALKEGKEKREALRKQRRAEQEANVRRKEQSKEAQRLQSRKANQHNEGRDAAAGEQADLDDDVDDMEWYRREVGQEPDAEFLSGTPKKAKKMGYSHERKTNAFKAHVMGKGFGLRKFKLQAAEGSRPKHKREGSNQGKKQTDRGGKASRKVDSSGKSGQGVADRIWSERKRKQEKGPFVQRKKKRMTQK